MASSSEVASANPANGQALPPVAEDAFIADRDAADSGAEDEDDEDGKGKDGKKSGRRKIKIEFINDKSRRHITFSKRKAGIMKKAYELSTLTGTQVLLLVVSETGLVYTFTTAKLQPLVTQPEGKNLIQACLNAPTGAPPNVTTSTPRGASSSAAAHGAAGDVNDDDDVEDTRPQKRTRGASNAGNGITRSSSQPGAPPHGTSSPTQQSQQQQMPQQQMSPQQHPQTQQHQPYQYGQPNPMYPPHMMQQAATSPYAYPNNGAPASQIPNMPGPHNPWGQQASPVDQGGYRR